MCAIVVTKAHDFHEKQADLAEMRSPLFLCLTWCDFRNYTAYIMSKAQDKTVFGSVAEFMRATGMSDTELAEYLDVDRSEAVRLRQGRTYRSLLKPLKVSKKCKVPIEKLAPSNAA